MRQAIIENAFQIIINNKNLPMYSSHMTNKTGKFVVAYNINRSTDNYVTGNWQIETKVMLLTIFVTGLWPIKTKQKKNNWPILNIDC